MGIQSAVPFIAETGGQNAMIVDSSALLEQAVDDIVNSAFGSAGQRCSALRALFVHQDIADDLIRLLQGAMQELRIGDPWNASTDLGPVIDAEARAALERQARALQGLGTRLAITPVPEGLPEGHWFAPRAWGDRPTGYADGGAFRPDPACPPLQLGTVRCAARQHQCDRLRPDLRHPQPHSGGV